MNKEILYGVIILNYNTFEDCQNAVKSIEKCAITDDYLICVVDGGSTKEGEQEAVRSLEIGDEHVISLILDHNSGYAVGNNEGFKYLKEKNNFKYTVIMNPDVMLNTRGTIEDIVNGIERYGTEIVGGQPLVSSADSMIPASEQINIRKCFTYRDFIISNLWILRRICKEEFAKLTYSNERPYCDNVQFEVPSGAFFIINTDIFEEVGLFDPDTFLYAEEMILGYKIKQLQKKFILFPEYIVNHYQGKSSGSHGTVSIKTLQRTMDSVGIYMNKYLKVKSLGVFTYRLICYVNRYTEWVEHLIVRMVKRKRK